MSKQLQLRHYLGYTLLCLIWGSTWMAIRVVVQYVPPLWAAALRFVTASAILLLIAVVRGLPFPLTKRQWKAVTVLSFTMMALYYGLIFWAEQYVNSSMAAVLFSSSPLVVALLTPLFSGKSVPRRAVIAMVVAFGGILALFQSGLRDSRSALLGGFAILGGVLTSSWSSIYAKRETSELNPLVSTGLQHGMGSVFLFAASFAMERHAPSNWNRSAVLALLYLTVFGSAITFSVFYWLLKHMEAYKLTTLNLVTPIVAIIVGAVLLEEKIPPIMLLAAAIVLGSVGFVLRAEAEQSAELNILRAKAE
jgi:drug/metabolite transporter (DMT)-like permease